MAASPCHIKHLVVGNMPTTGEQNARAPRLSAQRISSRGRCDGERDHVGRISRHVAGVYRARTALGAESLDGRFTIAFS